jgi:glycosyltransferase involved in cell wall biosynthesis
VRTPRVLHVLPHPGGGAERYIDLLEGMEGFSHERRHLSGGRSPAQLLRGLPRTGPTIRRDAKRSTLVHLHGDVATVVGLPLAAGRPALTTTHGLHLLRRLSGPRRSALALCLRLAIRSERAVICTSESERSELSSLLRAADLGKLRLVENGVEPPPQQCDGHPQDAETRDRLRAELGITPQEIVALFAGQLEGRKAPLMAARAAAAARAAGHPLVLLVAGEGPLERELQRLAGPAVRPLGYRHDLQRLLAATDIFLAPSHREGMSLGLLDAMWGAAAIVAADGPGNPEALGSAGVIVPAGDETALTAALIRLCAEPRSRRALGRSARARASERFTAERFRAQTRGVYLECLGAGDG